ncbi:uncharacterized protein LOC132565628 isoform X8 [Ylistrum balloti]|uniref:uncharacterized protein LOC132565628 isoform X8 n=1 Tax=Ylistrum balloti TaxID=509963 RepID=UPI002905E4C4|nr:uncharacterized protein LOC132565628 isoform X8 [Ylistrum balloti]
MNYQKFYTNGIHSSSLLCQLATMWKSQTLCDAIIKTGSINTKAHRLVLVAACPMLQSMDNASIGSHLEVRLASEIKQDSVNMFLQYLYEGFMMLTEDNHKDIEKIARLLQVDSVIKCCADFCKSLHEKTGLSVYSAGQYKYSSHDMLEFKHVRVSGIQKTVQDSMMKRHSDFQRPNSPGSKRPRMHRPGSPSDGQRGDNMYGHSSHSDSDRVPRLGLGSFPGAAGRNLQPGVVEVIEDSLELVQTEPVERDPVTGRPIDSRPPVQKTVAISVASQVTGGDPDLQIVNVSGVKDGTSSSSSTSRAQLSTATHTTSTPIARDSRGSFMHSSFSSQQSSQSMRSDIPMPSLSRASSDRTMSQMPRSDIQRSMQNQFSSEPQQQQQKQSSSQYPSIPQALIDMDFTAAKQKSDVFPTSLQKATDAFPTNLPKPSDVVFPGMQMSSQQNNTQQSKPFAAGSAGQVNQSVPVHINTSSSSSSPITSLPPVSPVIPDTSFSLSASPNSKSQPSTSRSESVERPGSGERMKEERPPTVDLVGPDISIVKIESTDKDETGALDMYVDTGDDGEVHPHGMEGDGEQTYEGGSDYDVEEPPGEMEGSNEGSNLSGDQNAWYLNTMKEGSAHKARRPKQDDIKELHMSHNTMTQPTKTFSQHGTLEQLSETFTSRAPQGRQQQPSLEGVRKQSEMSYMADDYFTPPTATGQPRIGYMDPPQVVQDPRATGDGQIEPLYMQTGTGVFPTGPDVPQGLTHRMIHTEGKKLRLCVYCSLNKVKTKSGWYVYTTHKCEACDVPLCQSRNCFVTYHKYMGIM